MSDSFLITFFRLRKFLYISNFFHHFNGVYVLNFIKSFLNILEGGGAVGECRRERIPKQALCPQQGVPQTAQSHNPEIMT